MTQADKQYKILIEDILKNGISDEGSDVRTVWADGSPAHTVSSFGKQIEFDGSEIPILTTKRIAWKTAIKEMLLFWVKQTTQEKDFNEENVSIWAEWFKDGNLGRSYAYQFESHRHHIREIVKITPRLREFHGELKPIFLESKDEINTDCNDKNIGAIMESKNCGCFQVLDVFPSGLYYNNSQAFKIRFLNTNAVRIVRKYDAIDGEVQDFFVRSVQGVGYLGNHKSVMNFTENQVKKLHVSWENMISRCYKNDNFGRYKENGVFVDERWHSFENFLRDIRCIPQFFLAKEDDFNGWSIDKDYYGSNSYSIYTTVWLTQTENKWYRNISRPFYAISKDGKKKLFLTTTECAKEIGLKSSAPITGCLNNKPNRKSASGHTFKYLEDDGFLYRYELSRNQVVELINNIQNNPQSRRLMTSFWNFADVDKKQLQECAWATDWNVSDGKLDLILIQRSVDVGLGACFNWFQYSVLQHMIAHVSGLEVGKFIHQTGNVHVYTRHIEDIAKQIEREPFEAPQLWINPEVKNFYDFTIDDFKLIGYKHGEKIPYEVAI